jgi:hypothetical protein
MVKKCIVCGEEATYKIKDTSDYYCQECAEENFADLSMLIKLEEEAQKLKMFLKEKLEEISRSERELDRKCGYQDELSEDYAQDYAQNN